MTLTPEAMIIGRFFIFQSAYAREDLSLLDRKDGIRDGSVRLSFHVRRRPHALMLDVPVDSVPALLDWLEAYRLHA